MNELRLSGIVGVEITADSVAEQLKSMAGDIVIFLNSPGGSFFEGAQIFNEIKNHPGQKTVKMGALVASAAAYVAMAATEIIAADNTSFMIHEVFTAAEGSASDLKRQADHAEKLNSLVCKRLSERSGKPESEIRQLMAAETWYYGKEIVDAGFADRLESTGQTADRMAAVASAQKQCKIAAMAVKKAASQAADHDDMIENASAESLLVADVSSADDELISSRNFEADGLVEY